MKNISELEAKRMLKNSGYKKTVTISFPKGNIKESHCHTFSADIIIISGSIEVLVGDKQHNLETGDSFKLAAGIEHSEYVGKDGVTIVADNHHDLEP